MSARALVLTYHAVERGPAPLCLEPALFREHVECLVERGAFVVTVSELASALRAEELPERVVAITFDDGFASVVEHAAPLLRERGLRATVFCVAGYLGRTNDWPTQPAFAPRLPLASVEALAELAAAGFEIGAHGFDHEPLDRASPEVANRELIEAKAALEHAVAAPVLSFACPYNLPPNAAARALIGAAYEAACLGGLAHVREGSDPLALPRVDAHYLRRPELLRRAVEGGLGPYLTARRLAARARRLVRRGY